MKTTTTAIVFSLVALSGCSKKKDAPKPPFAGPLTGDRIMAADNLVSPYDDWAKGLNKMEAQLGKPTRVKDNEYAWAIVEGDSCTYVEIEQDDRAKYNKGEKGLMVGAVQSPMKVDKKNGPMMNWSDCLAITGVTAGPPEDPNAAAPPQDGSAVPFDVFADVAIKGRSKWKGQRVKVSGTYTGTTTATSGDQAWITVSLRGAADGGSASLGCTLPAGIAAPTATLGDPITVEGLVEIQEWMSMGGADPRLEANLKECTVVPPQP